MEAKRKQDSEKGVSYLDKCVQKGEETRRKLSQSVEIVIPFIHAIYFRDPNIILYPTHIKKENNQVPNRQKIFVESKMGLDMIIEYFPTDDYSSIPYKTHAFMLWMPKRFHTYTINHSEGFRPEDKYNMRIITDAAKVWYNYRLILAYGNTPENPDYILFRNIKDIPLGCFQINSSPGDRNSLAIHFGEASWVDTGRAKTRKLIRPLGSDESPIIQEFRELQRTYVPWE